MQAAALAAAIVLSYSTGTAPLALRRPPLLRSTPLRCVEPPIIEPEPPTADPEPSTIDPVAAVFGTLYEGGKGKKIAWGVFQQDVDAASVPSPEEQARRRDQAAVDLVNIDDEERERRKVAGLALVAFTVAFGAALLGAHAPATARFAIAPPMFLGVGYLASYKEGL